MEYLGKPEGWRLGIVQVAQWWHSYNPSRKGNIFRGLHVHVHGLILDFGFDGERVIPFARMFISNDPGFKRLRALWLSNLRAEYGDFEVRDVDCWIGYEKGGAALKHELDYVFRSPVRDLYQTVEHECLPEGYSARWVAQMLRGRGHAQRISYYGYLSSVNMSPKSDFMAFLGLELLDRKSYNAERKKVYCPNCNCLMEPVLGCVEDTDEVIARGGQFLVPVSPWSVIGIPIDFSIA
jgi:hypothetical protein